MTEPKGAWGRRGIEIPADVIGVCLAAFVFVLWWEGYFARLF